MTALLDTGFLLAVLDADDELHDICSLALEEEREPILPDMVIPELAYLVLRELGYPALIKFLDSIVKGELVLERATIPDLARSAEVLEKYADNKIDFVDCAIVAMAMAERLNIKRILTVDQRDFQKFRPKHCSAFEIVP
jgi:hypothetical protein